MGLIAGLLLLGMVLCIFGIFIVVIGFFSNPTLQFISILASIPIILLSSAILFALFIYGTDGGSTNKKSSKSKSSESSSTWVKVGDVWRGGRKQGEVWGRVDDEE